MVEELPTRTTTRTTPPGLVDMIIIHTPGVVLGTVLVPAYAPASVFLPCLLARLPAAPSWL